MIHDSIVKHAFVADPQNPQMTVTRYIRPFYAIGFAVMYTVLGWHPDQGHKKSAASVRIESVAPTSTTSPPSSQ